MEQDRLSCPRVVFSILSPSNSTEERTNSDQNSGSGWVGPGGTSGDHRARKGEGGEKGEGGKGGKEQWKKERERRTQERKEGGKEGERKGKEGEEILVIGFGVFLIITIIL